MFGQDAYRKITKEELKGDMVKTYEQDNKWNFKESLRMGEEIITVTIW